MTLGQISISYWNIVVSPNLALKLFMITGCDMLKTFDLDLKLKVTQPFEGQKFEILSSLLLKIESGKKNIKGNLM